MAVSSQFRLVSFSRELPATIALQQRAAACSVKEDQNLIDNDGNNKNIDNINNAYTVCEIPEDIVQGCYKTAHPDPSFTVHIIYYYT